MTRRRRVELPLRRGVEEAELRRLVYRAFALRDGDPEAYRAALQAIEDWYVETLARPARSVLRARQAMTDYDPLENAAAVEHDRRHCIEVERMRLSGSRVRPTCSPSPTRALRRSSSTS